MLRPNTILRPYLSDSWPKIGAAKNVHSEYMPVNQPTMIKPWLIDHDGGMIWCGPGNTSAT